MRKIFFIILLTFGFINCALAAVVFHDTQGNTATGFKSKWLIVNYWAPWCDACQQEVAELNRFAEHMQAKNVMVYGVDFDVPPVERLQVAANQLGVTFPVLTQDPGDAWQLEEVAELPTTFIINPQGQVVKKIIGPTTETVLMSTLQQLHVF